MITCFHLTKAYGPGPDECALHPLDLHLDKGDFVSIRGLVGSGKTTLLKLLCGLTAPTSGEIEVGGLRLPASRRQVAALRRKMGIIEQEPRLMERSSVYDNVALGLETAGQRGAALKSRTMQALRGMGLEPFAWLAAGKLSAGQRQKVSVARALAREPLIVLADEPCRHLDPAGSADVASYLRWLNLQGATILVTGGAWWPEEGPGRCLTLERGRLLEAAAEGAEARVAVRADAARTMEGAP